MKQPNKKHIKVTFADMYQAEMAGVQKCVWNIPFISALSYKGISLAGNPVGTGKTSNEAAQDLISKTNAENPVVRFFMTEYTPTLY